MHNNQRWRQPDDPGTLSDNTLRSFARAAEEAAERSAVRESLRVFWWSVTCLILGLVGGWALTRFLF
jgi:fatty acid desaturase